MSSSKVNKTEENSEQICYKNRRYVWPTTKRKFEKSKKIRESIRSLCDDSSSSEDSESVQLADFNLQKTNTKDSSKQVKEHAKHKRLGLKHNKDSSVENIQLLSNNNLELERKKMSNEKCKVSVKESLKSKNHGSNKREKTDISNDAKEQEDKNGKVESNGSETDNVSQKHVKKRHTTLKSAQSNCVHLHKDEVESSSGKEFQGCKKSTPSSTEKHTDGKTIEKLCFCPKCKIIALSNKFKEVCSEYELKMECVKRTHLKEELTYQEYVNIIIKQSKDAISKLKMLLNAQENELMRFSGEWTKKWCLRDLIYGSEDEESIVSECDSKEIFSENEGIPISIEKNKKNEVSVPVEVSKETVGSNETVTSLEDNDAVSPILGNNKRKIVSNKPHSKIKSVTDTSKENSAGCQKGKMNDSLQDIFDELSDKNDEVDNIVGDTEMEFEKLETLKTKKSNEKIQTVADSNNDSNVLKEFDNSESDVTAETTVVLMPVLSRDIPSSSDDNESVSTLKIEKDVNRSSSAQSEVLNDDQLKKPWLETDSETFSTDEFIPATPTKVSTNGNMNDIQTEKSKSERENETNVTSDTSVNEDSELYKMDISEFRAKRYLLDSNSDDSMGSSSTKGIDDKAHESDDNSENRQAKASLVVSSNSESSNSDNGNSLECTKVPSSKVQKVLTLPLSKQDSLPDEVVGNFDLSVSERVKNRRRKVISKRDFKSDKKLEMKSYVVLENLPKKILQKHADALEKSRQHLDSKQIKSLINLDSLQRDSKKKNDLPQSSSFMKKSKGSKATEDTLLDHLKKVENEKLIDHSEEDIDGHSKSTPEETQCDFQTNEELIIEADREAKNMLLSFENSDVENQNVVSQDEHSDEEKDKKVKNSTVKSSKKPEKKASTSDEDDESEREKRRWRESKLLTMNISTSDSEVECTKWKIKQEKLKKKAEENETENSDANTSKIKRKIRPRRKILDSDSDVQLVNSDSDSVKSLPVENDKSSDTDSSSKKKQKKTRKRRVHKSSDTDSSLAEKKVKPKRKRIKNMDTDSDDASDDEMNNSQGTPNAKGRKNIRKVMKDKQVAENTKQAAKEEEERIKRIADRQKLYNQMYEARLASEEKVEKLVLDFNTETKEELVVVHPDIVKRLKPHQAKGIKFMWDACFESLEQIKTSTGSGCIIAHCMGLGKSLQVIALSHTLLTHEETGVKTIMIVCPLSTVLNWYNEFNLWLKDIEDNDIEVHELTKLKKNVERKYQLQSWYRTGGVLLIGYEMFRNLSGVNNRMRKAMKEEVLRYLIDPGPDLIVCDEGHLLKNEDTALSKSMKRIKTLRRIVLTGTPLQNNLTEYHCMVQFVKPNLLGTKREFLNRFANPITNGQFDDSTEYDVKLMKKRAYVLHKMLKGCVQRFDYSVLTPFLPPKQEYVIFVRLSDVQMKMYRYYLDNISRRQRSEKGSLFADFQSLQRIWTHPVVLRLNAEKVERMNEKKLSSDSEGSLKDFINDDSESDSTTTSSSSDENENADSAESNPAPKNIRSTRSTNPDVAVVIEPEETEKKDEEWWTQFIEPDDFEDMSISSKLVLLFAILKECEQLGDKVLVFSQSLYSLTLIEKFLKKIDDETQKDESSEYMGHRDSWSLGLDYFRLDGQTSAENRSIWCKIFNRPTNTRARLFLISTRAGGLGINLTAANRVIIFDASWNPSYDVQSIFRVYRFGQKKPCYVYRFLAAGTMEEKIYNRQVTKLSLSCRVVDEQQIERHYRNHDLNELYNFEPYTDEGRPTLNLPKDRLLAEIFLKHKDLVENYHEHDSLLENKAEEELNEEERKQAWLEYEEEKKGKPPLLMYTAPTYPTDGMINHGQLGLPWSNINTDYEKLQQLIRKDYPNATPEYQQMMTARVLTDMYSYWEKQAFHNTSANRLPEMNAGLMQHQMRTQVQNLAPRPHVIRNTNNVSGQERNEIPSTGISTYSKSADADDDVVEVIPTTTNNKNNKNQEE
ncbi:uncharacterized protein LOC116427168 [Nomia melanderi]|uniref:uncharacterized protein LOC116427168 n=1 Tax=Nomia melanderi TaxID=2448451 RepID=UPI0013047814|nr:transcriptional regulator ATRX homolog [Nomia melanderi]